MAEHGFAEPNDFTSRVLRYAPARSEIEIHLAQVHRISCNYDGTAQAQQRSGQRSVLTVRAWADGGCALVSTHGQSLGSARDAVLHAVALARQFPGSASPVPRPDGTPPVASAPFLCPAPDVADLAGRLFQSIPVSLVAEVDVTWQHCRTAVLSTAGVNASGQAAGTSAAALVVMDSIAEPADAVVSQFARGDEDGMLGKLMERLDEHDRRRSAIPATDLPDGFLSRQPRVLVRPLAMARLLDGWAQRVLLPNNPDQPEFPAGLASSAVCLTEDALEPDGPLSYPHDGEGLWSRRIILVEHGRLVERPQTTTTARALMVRPNACAIRDSGAGPRPGLRGLRLGRSDPAAASDHNGSAEDLAEIIDAIVAPGTSTTTTAAIALALTRHRLGYSWLPLRLPWLELLRRIVWLGADPAWAKFGVQSPTVLLNLSEQHSPATM